MNVSAKDKRIKALMRGERLVAGLHRNEEKLILDILSVLAAVDDLPTVSMAHPAWRVHHHKPRKAHSPWSIDVTGPARFMFEYNKRTPDITGAKYIEYT